MGVHLTVMSDCIDYSMIVMYFVYLLYVVGDTIHVSKDSEEGRGVLM